MSWSPVDVDCLKSLLVSGDVANYGGITVPAFFCLMGALQKLLEDYYCCLDFKPVLFFS
jgi:hypothetical protein